MKSTYVDPNTGDVVCPVCGARNQFTVKRTAKAKWTGVVTVGVGMAAMPKRLSCNGCGTNLKRGGASGQPEAKTRAAPKRPEKPDRSVSPQLKWDKLVDTMTAKGVLTRDRFNSLSHPNRRYIVMYNGAIEIDLRTHEAVAKARQVPDVSTTSRGGRVLVRVPLLHSGEWERLVGLAIAEAEGRNLDVDPDPADTSQDATLPEVTTEPTDQQASLVGELERLADLHTRGVLTDGQFETAKERLLGR